MKVVCILFPPGTATSVLAECCLRVSPQVALGEHWIFIEIGKCQKLYSEETVLKRLRILLSRFGVFAHLAVAEDLPTALAFARYKTKNRDCLPVRALKDYLNPFSYDSHLEKMLIQMDKLGIYTIEDFIQVPRKTLVTRFGKEGLWAAQHLNEAHKIVWPHFKVEEKIQENLILSTGPEALEALLFYIKTLTDRVASRLLGRGERVSRFELCVHQEKFSHVIKPIRSFIFDLPLAQSAGVSLLSLIRERLNTQLSREPLQSEVEYLELKVLDTVPLKSSQKDFLNRDEEEREAWASLIGRLEEKLGPQSAFLVQIMDSYLPEKAWSRHIQEDTTPKSSTPPYAKRPLRILRMPLPLIREGAKLKTKDAARETSWEIQYIDGPERIREEWWDFGTERDYYQIITKTGEKLWIFQKPDSSQLSTSSHLFLHGVFD